MAKIDNISNRAEEPKNFSQSANEQIGSSSYQQQMRQTDVRQQEEQRMQPEKQRQQEEENQLNARLALLELETSGKQFFKPSYGNHHILTFDRKQAFLVKGTPSQRLTRRVQDRNDKNISHEVPVTEWVHEITHENGDTQTWTITSKELQRMI